MSKAVVPSAPLSVYEQFRGEPLPSLVTFMVEDWFVEMDHEMGSLRTFRLLPQKTANQYVAWYEVDERRPRFDFSVVDAWLSTQRHCLKMGHIDVITSRTFFSPEKADDKLYFGRPPHYRIEFQSEQLIEDREILCLLSQSGYEIPSLLQRLP